MKRTVKRLSLGAAALALGGCQILFDLKSHVDDATGGSGTGTSAGGTGTSAGGSGGAGTSSGTVTGTVCTPGATEKCDYSGPDGTEGVGPCKAPERTCNVDGTAWSMCQGEVTPKTEDCSKPGDEDCNFGGVGCSEAVWSKIFANYANPVDVATDAKGNIYIFGGFQGTLTFGDTTLVALDENDLFLAKLDSQGKPVWAKKYGDLQDQRPISLALDPAGNPIVAGNFSGTLDFGKGPLVNNGLSDIYVAKLDPGGGELWAKQFGNDDQQDLSGMAVDGLGNVVLAGHASGMVNFEGPSIPSGGGFIARLESSSGTGLWAKPLEDDNGGFLYGGIVATDATGGIALLSTLAGTYTFAGKQLTGNYRVFILRFDPAGNPAWSHDLGLGALQLFGVGLKVDNGGNTVFAVATPEDAPWAVPTKSFGKHDVVVGKLDPIGDPQWGFRWGGPGDELGPRIDVQKNGRALVAFGSDGVVELGEGSLPMLGKYDVLVADLGPEGSI